MKTRLLAPFHLITLGAITFSLSACGPKGTAPIPTNPGLPNGVPSSLQPLVPPVTQPSTPTPLPQPIPQPVTAPPERPTGLSLRYIDDTAFELSWQPGLQAQAYFVILNGEVVSEELTDTIIEVGDITPSASYTVQIGSLNEMGRSAQVTRSTFQPDQFKPAAGTEAQPALLQEEAIPTEEALNPSAPPSSTPSGTPSTTPSGEPSVLPSSVPSSVPSTTPSASPTTAPTDLGNASLGFLNTPTMESLRGIAVSGSTVYMGWYKTRNILGGDFTYQRSVRVLDLGSGETEEITAYSTFSDSSPPTPLINGVAVSGGEIWTAFNAPDSEGFNVYRHDSTGARVDRYKVASSAGTVLQDIVVGNGNAYIASPTTNSIIRFSTSDASNADAEFVEGISPVGVALDSAGNLYVTNSNGGKVQKYNSSGELDLEFDGTGKNGKGTAFSAIGDVAIDPRNGDIYVVANAGGVKLFRYNQDGNFINSVSHPGLSDPDKMAIGSNGHIYVVDKGQKTAVAFDAGK